MGTILYITNNHVTIPFMHIDDMFVIGDDVEEKIVLAMWVEGLRQTEIFFWNWKGLIKNMVYVESMEVYSQPSKRNS